jgi:hypothetical protein
MTDATTHLIDDQDRGRTVMEYPLCDDCCQLVQPIPAGSEVPVGGPGATGPTAIVEDDMCPECGCTSFTYDAAEAAEAATEELDRIRADVRCLTEAAREVRDARERGATLLQAERNLIDALSRGRDFRRLLGHLCDDCGRIGALYTDNRRRLCASCRT